MNMRRSILVSVFVIALSAIVTYRETTKVGQELIAEARARAARNHKFLIVEFGAEWCSDCAQLSKSLKDERRRDLFQREFELLYVDVGEFNRNLDIAKSLGIDVTEAIPTAVFFPPMAWAQDSIAMLSNTSPWPVRAAPSTPRVSLRIMKPGIASINWAIRKFSFPCGSTRPVPSPRANIFLEGRSARSRSGRAGLRVFRCKDGSTMAGR